MTTLDLTPAHAPADDTVGLFDVQIVVDAARHYINLLVLAYRNAATAQERSNPTVPTFVGACLQSRDPRIADLGDAADTGSFATSGDILATAQRTLVKKLGINEALAVRAITALKDTPGITYVVGADTWFQLRHEALGNTYDTLNNACPQYLADVDHNGKAYDSSDAGIDGEDLGICTTLKRLNEQLAGSGRHGVLYTADRHLAHGAPHILPPAEGRHCVWYEHNGGKWDAWRTGQLNGTDQAAYLGAQRNARKPANRDVRLPRGPQPPTTAHRQM